MAVNDNIRLVKGIYDLTLETFKDTENIKNGLIVIPGITSIENQINVPNKSQIVDLLRVTHTWVLGCKITAQTSPTTKTAKEVKDELIIMAQGARTNGGPVTLYHEDSTYTVYIQDLVFKKEENDNVVETYTGEDSIEYEATLTLIEGEAA